MRVDFYQLAGTPVEKVVPQLAEKILESGARLLLVAGDAQLLDMLDAALWHYEPASYLPHGQDNPDRQPILLAKSAAGAGEDRLTMLADGRWDDAALASERVFYLFDDASIDAARKAWRSVSAEGERTRHYWTHQDGRWREKG